MNKNVQPIIDSRHLKVLSAKKEDLKDAVVFVCLDEEKYGYYDMAQLQKAAETLDRIEPSASFFIGLKNFRVQLYDRAAVKNRDIVITVSHHAELDVDLEEVEKSFRDAFPEAKSIKFVHHYAESLEVQ